MRYSKCNDRYFVKSYRFCVKPYLTQDLCSASLTQPYMKWKRCNFLCRSSVFSWLRRLIELNSRFRPDLLQKCLLVCCITSLKRNRHNLVCGLSISDKLDQWNRGNRKVCSWIRVWTKMLSAHFNPLLFSSELVIH